jgi:hypothetical protein
MDSVGYIAAAVPILGASTFDFLRQLGGLESFEPGAI